MSTNYFQQLLVNSEIYGERAQPNWNLYVAGGDAGSQSLLHCVDSLVGEAGTLEVGPGRRGVIIKKSSSRLPDFDGLLGQLSLDVLDKNLNMGS